MRHSLTERSLLAFFVDVCWIDTFRFEPIAEKQAIVDDLEVCRRRRLERAVDRYVVRVPPAEGRLVFHRVGLERLDLVGGGEAVGDARVLVGELRRAPLGAAGSGAVSGIASLSCSTKLRNRGAARTSRSGTSRPHAGGPRRAPDRGTDRALGVIVPCVIVVVLMCLAIFGV